MEIQPLCPELIAKLEIAVAHRNRERAVAVIERYFEELGKPPQKGLTNAIASILPPRMAAILEREGFLLVEDFKDVKETDLVTMKGIGPKLIELLKKELKSSITTTAQPGKKLKLPQ